ncbi:hypothetical protein TNIN_440621 [Trichonephila inaurata madagascariensis]|uniref:Uncharacterized protein n=1 Tax=Trichonephila inaurata madagascariensis TaxID=2747483 RepID=A0A8X6Y617_9ARAC|nr:hypothetical protein TNIN_440621 [Trichonephila inaurata madagascariensis]
MIRCNMLPQEKQSFIPRVVLNSSVKRKPGANAENIISNTKVALKLKTISILEALILGNTANSYAVSMLWAKDSCLGCSISTRS